MVACTGEQESKCRETGNRSAGEQSTRARAGENGEGLLESLVALMVEVETKKECCSVTVLK